MFLGVHANDMDESYDEHFYDDQGWEIRYIQHPGRTSTRTINSFDTSAVTDMNEMFRHAVNFDQNVNGWDTSAVKTMTRMFAGATLMSAQEKPAGAP